MAERLLEDRPVNRPSDTAIVDPGAPEQAPPGEGPIDKAEALQSLLARMQGGSDFPAQSSAVREVSCMASSDHENLRRLSHAVMQDVALSQRLLRLANSSAYRPAGQDSVSTVSRALMVLGMDTVRTLALSLLLFDNVADVPRARLIRDEFLRAITASTLAQSVLAKGTRVWEEAGLAAMFHRLGQLMVLHHLPEMHEQLQALSPGEPTHAQAERDARRVLGVTYAELGCAVAQSWGFPDVLLQGIRRLDTADAVPRCTTHEATVRTAASFAADVCDAVASVGLGSAAAFDAVRRRYALSLEIKEGAMEPMLRHARERTSLLASALGIDLAASGFGRLLSGADVADAASAATVSGARRSSSSATGAPARAPQRARVPADPEQRRRSLSRGLQSLAERVAANGALHEVLKHALETLHESLACRRALFALREPSGEALVGRLSAGDLEHTHLRHFRIFIDEDGNLLSACARKGADLLISDATAPNIASRLPLWFRQHFGAGSFLLLPLSIGGATRAMIYADTEDSGGLQIDATALGLVRDIRNQALTAFRQAGSP